MTSLSNISRSSIARPDAPGSGHQPAGASSYRDFRTHWLREIEVNEKESTRDAGRHYYEDRWWEYEDGEPPQRHPLRAVRKKVSAMRRSLENQAIGEFVHEAVDIPEGHLRRALRIPASIPLERHWLVTLLQAVCSVFAPATWNLWWTRRRLRRVGTLEGRHLVFRKTLKLLLWHARFDYYSEAIDFVMRRFEGPLTPQELDTLSRREPAWLRALFQLGLRSAPAQLSFGHQKLQSQDGALAEVLVREGAILSAEELMAWWPWKQEDRHHHRRDFTPDLLPMARRVIRRLLDLGANRQAVVAACLDAVPRFWPDRLGSHLELIAGHGMVAAGLVESVGASLWLGRTERLTFVLDVLKVRSPQDLGLFTTILRSREAPSQRLAEALQSRGATLEGLAACQTLMLKQACDDGERTALYAIELLSASPFNFDAASIGCIDAYAKSNDTLQAFLSILARHHLVDAQTVLQFARCFRSIQLHELDLLLTIVLPRRDSVSAVELIDWVEEAGRDGWSDAIRTMVDLLRLQRFEQLQQCLKFASLGSAVLRYLIEGQSLMSLAALGDWYYHRADGIKELRIRASDLSEIQRLCLDDAFARKRFARVNHNIAELVRARRQRAEQAFAQELRSTGQAQELNPDVRHDRIEQICAQQWPQLRDDAVKVLTATDGLVPASVLNAPPGSDDTLERRLALFIPLVQDLLAGRGPHEPGITDLEADAISMVYKTTSTHLTAFWPHLVGHEQDLASLRLADHYPMTWKATHYVLRGGATPDGKTLERLASIPHSVARFIETSAKDLSLALKGLRPSRIGDEAADLVGLQQHLAVLCALSSGDDQVRDQLESWRRDGERWTTGDIRCDDIEALLNFFTTGLADGVESQIERVARRLSAADIDLLTDRLAPRASMDEASAQGRLREAARRASAKVCKRYGAWARSERRKFVAMGTDGEGTNLQAVLTKTPAAFFAKEAAGLCSRANTDMWKEARHSHLVVFDVPNRRIAGMALMYVQKVLAVDAERPTLIMRAINPIEPYSDSHDPSSMVDAFLAVAVAIAQDNGLAAVAMPDGGGQHLLSNKNSIERDLVERYLRHSRGHYGREPLVQAVGRLDTALTVEAPFAGYAEADRDGKVASISLLWLRGMDKPVVPARQRGSSTR